MYRDEILNTSSAADPVMLKYHASDCSCYTYCIHGLVYTISFQKTDYGKVKAWI